MGIAKTINAVGEYNFYSTDYINFAELISMFFNVNLEISIQNYFDEEETIYKNLSLNFDKINTYKLSINVYEKDVSKSNENIYCQYELYIPVNFEFENELLLEFYANGIFQLNYIPFNATWNFFIQDLIGLNDLYYNSHQHLINEKSEIRKVYIKILKKIKCKEVIIMTDAYYNVENEIQNNINSKNLNDLVIFMKEIDKIKLYNLVDVVNQKVVIKSGRYSFLDIALFDNFNDKI